MSSSVRLLAAAVLAVAAQSAVAQTVVPPTVTVQQLAPQLVPFAGSPLNFQSLVNGLAAGGPVQLVSVLPNGFSQVVTFTPTAALAPADIARVLETARQQLISLGIGTPTAEQIGFTLMGGVVPTPLGGTPVAGALRPNPPSVAAQIQQGNAAGGTTSATPGSTTTSATPAAPGAPLATTPPVTSAVNVQLVPTPTTAPAATAPAATAPAASAPAVQRQTSDSLTAPGATSRSPAASISATPPAAAAPTAPGAASGARATERAAPGPARVP
jgi:hypothetical protein